jgi:hypothetical protein
MALASTTTPGDIQLAGDLTGNATSPQLITVNSTPGSYLFPSITVDGKGRLTAITNASASQVANWLPKATTSVYGVVTVPTSGNIVVSGGAISVPLATNSVKGVVTAGSYITISAGVMSVNVGSLPSATTTTKGLVRVPTAGRLTVSNGDLSVPIASTTTLGVVKIGSGITVSNGIINAPLPVANTTSLGGVIVGSGLNVAANGQISLNLSSLPVATTSSAGVVQIGENLTVANGVVSIPIATANTPGVVKVGSGLDVTGGVVSVNANAIPIATSTVLGRVKVPSAEGISVDDNGSISWDANNATQATTTSYGVVKVGTGLKTVGGVLQINNDELPRASNTVYGVVRVPGGDGLVANNGVLTFNPQDAAATANTPGVVAIGANIDVAANGEISIPVGSNTVYGVVRSANTDNIVIINGNVDVGLNIAKTTEQNNFTKSQTFTPESLIVFSGNTTVNLANSNFFTLTLTGNTILNNPTNKIAGGVYTFLIKQDGTGNRTLGFGTNYKFRLGIQPSNTKPANSVDVMTCIDDGTNLYCFYNKDLK